MQIDELSIDKEASFDEIDFHINQLIGEYQSLLWDIVHKMEANYAKVTFRKLRKLKKAALFKMLRNATGKTKEAV